MKQQKRKTSFLNFFRLAFRNRMGEALLLPFTRGKTWDSFFARIPANHYQYRKGSIRNVKRNGSDFVLDISDYMQWLIYFGIGVEPREKLFSLIRPGMTVFDVGANIGETALAFSRLTGPQGHVYAFEPDPATFRKLQQHLALNKVQNVTALNFGLGNAEGTFHLEQNEKHSGGNRIGSDQGVKVEIKRGDDFSGTLNRKPDFIKIDVEGFELRVLSGLNNTIRAARPQLFVETIDEYLLAQGNSASDVVQWISAHNYRMENAASGANIHAGDDVSGMHCDIIATPL